MKKLLILSLIWCSTAFSASVTNKVVNTIMITSTNSPIEVGFYLEAGKWMATNANAQAFTHGLFNYNTGNPVVVLRNVHPDGLGGFWIQNSLGTDVAFLQWNNNTSNLFLRNGITTKSLTVQVDGGVANTQWQSAVITNNGAVVFTGNVTFNGAITNSGGAVPSVLSTNVMADFPLIAAASFSDISYPLTGTITNMVSNLGNPAAEDGSLIVDCSIPSNGFVRIRARNVGSLAMDQGNLPYRIHVTQTPAQ